MGKKIKLITFHTHLLQIFFTINLIQLNLSYIKYYLQSFQVIVQFLLHLLNLSIFINQTSSNLMIISIIIIRFMNLLKDSIISEYGNKFINTEPDRDYPEISIGYKTNYYEGAKFLDSSLNNRLQSHSNKNQKKQDEQQPKIQIEVKQENDQEKYGNQLFDFHHLDKSLYNNSGIDLIHYSIVGGILQNPNLEITKKQHTERHQQNFCLYLKQKDFIESEKYKEKTTNWLEKNQQCISEEVPQQIKVIKNETKNIPKNYGKAIISFIEKNKVKVTELICKKQISYNELLNEFKIRKRTINTIADLRNLWTHGKYSIEMRILSNLFLRKYALQYIFNSRITNYASHIKYRHKLREALTYPDNFKNIKDY